MAKQRKAQAAGPQWRDLRDWLELVDALGELKHVRGASSEEDIGAITEMLDHNGESPCVLFDEIPNFKPGYRVLANSMGSRVRQAVTLGIDPAEASHDRLLQFWRELLKGFAPIPPVAPVISATLPSSRCPVMVMRSSSLIAVAMRRGR